MMTKILKITGLGVAALLGLLLLLVVAILLLVDPNDYRDDITAAVQDATGRELSIEGDLSLSLFPWLGLSLGETRLSNAAGEDTEKDFARVESVDINVKLLPLLQQRIEMKTLHLRGLRVNLSRTADGRSNWDGLLAAPTTDAAPATKSPAEESEAKPALALVVGGINIEDAQIVWDDRQAGQRIEIDRFSLRTGPIAPGAPVDIELRTRLAMSEPALQTPIELKGRLTFDLSAQRYRLDGLDVSLNVQSELLPVSPLNVRLRGNIDADIAQQRVQLAGLQLQTLGLTANAELNIQEILSIPQAKGQLSLAGFSPRELTKMLAIELPESTDISVLNKAALNLDFTGSADAMNVSSLDVVLDDSQLTGSLSVEDFSQPAVRFDLMLDDMDVDRYLPPATESPPPAPTATTAEDPQLPLDLLRGLDVKGKLRAGKIKLANARLADIVLGVTAKSGTIQLLPLQADLYKGQYRGHIVLDVREDIPKISADEKISAVQVGPLLKDVLGDDKASGTVNLAAKITTLGITPEVISKNLNGTASFDLSDGAIKGVNLGQMIREAYAKIKKKPAPEKTDNQTDFAQMSGSVRIRNGVVDNQDLQIKSPMLRVTGKGRVDLPKQRIDYLLNTSIVETDQGQGGKDVSELKALTIPIKVSGTFAEPKFKLDLAPVLKAKAKTELKRQKEKLEKEVDKKLKEEKARAKKKAEKKLKEKLEGLFR
ncbi:MAG: AsmA family protein [Gammaproteobacteria bacterium]|nr:AsmA family protein [Gammaproteobacteria bacterium]MCF6260806.1 AsmA family protein [Gammaproteobacteria bacterium]